MPLSLSPLIALFRRIFLVGQLCFARFAALIALFSLMLFQSSFQVTDIIPRFFKPALSYIASNSANLFTLRFREFVLFVEFSASVRDICMTVYL